MNVKSPGLYKHHDGRWMTRWAGKNRYFGRDHEAALPLYAESLKEWSLWRAEVRRAMKTPPKRRWTVTEVAENFIDAKALQSPRLREYYTKHLKRFTSVYGPFPADNMGVPQIQALKNEMLKNEYAHKTVNHDIIAAKAMLTWAIDQTMIPYRSLRGVKALPLGPPPFKALDYDRVCEMIYDAPEPQQQWLAVNYLTAARPTEVVRVVGREGDFVEEGIFRLHVGKTDRSSGMARHLVFSPLALLWLKRCPPTWRRLDSYSAAVRRVCGPGGPHPLRHSAATHLIQAGATRADVELILGHLPPRVALIYAPVVWQPLRQTAALLKL